MKITHNKIGQNLNSVDGAKSQGVDSTKSKNENTKASSPLASELGSTASKVNLSERAQDIKRAKEIATSAPDIDEEKVARFQKMIDEGKYKVDAKEIANKMVDEQLLFS